MNSLTSLNLDNNPLNVIAADFWVLAATCLPFLQELSFSKIGIERLQDEISQVVGLRILKLRDNKLTELPAGLAKLSDLEILDVRNNKLSTFPPAFTKLGKVRSFMRHLSFAFLPYHKRFPLQLKVLAAGNNSIEVLPSELTSLTSLQVLDLSLNHLNEIPEFICSIYSLVALHLDHNSVKSLPSSLIELTRLQFLNLSGNEVLELPKDLYKLRSLRTLRANDNKIKSLPSKISGMTALQVRLFLPFLPPTK